MTEPASPESLSRALRGRSLRPGRASGCSNAAAAFGQGCSQSNVRVATLLEMRSFMRYLCLSTLMASLLLTAVSLSRASDGPLDRDTLRGLSAVQVLVEKLDDDAKRAGFDVNTIQTDVELKLRLAGIKVLTAEERLNTPGCQYLYVQILSASPFKQRWQRLPY